MTPLPLTAPLLLITNPPQSPGPGMQTETRTEGHETAAASDTSTGCRDPFGLSFRLVKMALELFDAELGVADPIALTFPPLMVIGPPSDLTTSPEPTVSFPPSSVKPPSNRYPRACVDGLLLGVIQVRSLVTVPSIASASSPFPLPTLPRMFRTKSADTAFR